MKTFLKIQQILSIILSKKIIVLALFIIICFTITQAQDTSLIGTWKSIGPTVTSLGSVTNTIQIADVSREGFIGTKTSELNNDSHAKITITITGAFRGRGLYLQDGDVLHKDAGNVQWPDCSACTHESKMRISRDSLVLIDSISDCDNGCNGVTIYYRLLSEYDSTTQRHLADRFGRPADIIAFQPFHQQEKTLDSNNNNEPSKNNVTVNTAVNNTEAIKRKEQDRQDSLDNIARIKQQQKDDAIRIAQQKKLQKEITDSLNVVQQKEKQHLKDSLNNRARLEKIRLRTEDSLRDVQAKNRQREIADSLNLVKQKEQQHIKDSMDNVARTRQQHINDSALVAQQKKRQQQITDSLDLVKKKQQQHINDSLSNVARLERIKQQAEDSLQNAQLKKRQQEITDSLAAVRKQQYNDSLQKAVSAKAVQPTADSNSKALTTRTNVLLGTYHITTPDILIELFDNGEIDGDRVSVYHNNSKIVDNQMLTKTAITLNIHADSSNREHEFVLVAENLGSIPPNSALMRITVGDQIYKLSVNTDMKTNARIVFYYDGN